MKAGELARRGESEVLERAAFEALPFGLVVCAEGSSERWARLPSSASDVSPRRLLGVALRARGVPLLPRGAAASIARRGRVWVVAEEEVVAEELPVYVRVAPSGGLLQLGALRASPDPIDPATTAALSRALWRSRTDRGGAWVEFS